MSRAGFGAMVVLAAASLAGCVTAPPAAVLSYAHKDCAAKPELSAAASLIAPKPKAPLTVTKPLDQAAPCLTRQAGATPYQVFALPSDAEYKVVTVGSVLEQARLVPPTITVLDRQGETTRAFAPTDFFFRGLVYSVQFRPRPGEAYIVTEVDPARVGKTYDSIAIGTNTTTFAAGGAVGSWTSGVDQRVVRTFSYEGSVQVQVNDTRPAKDN